MKQIIFIFIFFFCVLSSPLFSQGQDAESNSPLDGMTLLKTMHDKFYHGPCKSYTFSQRNTHYRNDSVIRHSEWREVIEFPDKFRINFDQPGKYVVFKKDSVFTYKEGAKVNRRSDSSSLLLLIGGMYYRQIEDVLVRLKNAGYNLHTFSEQVWNDKQVFVIGAKMNDLVSNQVWIDKKTLCVVRILETINVVDIMDMRFETHQPWCHGFVETKVSFRRNGHLEQVEEYFDIKPSDGVFPE